ncbi:unnamed protein product [Rotaria sordida]|uniref:Ion transport domain-containing protein n=1 Tax=Rotaria sordida TaxID=392033 RepID=A0A814DFM9_9BILA|nr:unnamed protein product [Rotaria sordida]CAF0992984.1 unnamed protein product [Rotaria sordida]
MDVLTNPKKPINQYNVVRCYPIGRYRLTIRLQKGPLSIGTTGVLLKISKKNPILHNVMFGIELNENDAYGTFVFLYAVAFVVISNVLLLNILIAMFNERIGEMNIEKEYAEMYWKDKVFMKGIQLSTKQALKDLKTNLFYKINRDNERQIEDFQNVKV